VRVLHLFVDNLRDTAKLLLVKYFCSIFFIILTQEIWKMLNTNLIAVKLNVPGENLGEVFPFLHACEGGYTTIFNVLSEPERYQQDLEALEQARDGGATGVDRRQPVGLENSVGSDVDAALTFFYAVFPTEQQANKFAKETGADKVDVFNSTDDSHDLIPIDDVIETLASWEQRPKGMDMSGKTVAFVGRTFFNASKKWFKKSAERIGANVARIIKPNVDYVVFSERWRETHDKYLELTQAMVAIPLNEDQWAQIVVDCGGSLRG
jgi:hypothetical protein